MVSLSLALLETQQEISSRSIQAKSGTGSAQFVFRIQAACTPLLPITPSLTCPYFFKCITGILLLSHIAYIHVCVCVCVCIKKKRKREHPFAHVMWKDDSPCPYQMEREREGGGGWGLNDLHTVEEREREFSSTMFPWFGVILWRFYVQFNIITSLIPQTSIPISLALCVCVCTRVLWFFVVVVLFCFFYRWPWFDVTVCMRVRTHTGTRAHTHTHTEQENCVEGTARRSNCWFWAFFQSWSQMLKKVKKRQLGVRGKQTNNNNQKNGPTTVIVAPNF